MALYLFIFLCVYLSKISSIGLKYLLVIPALALCLYIFYMIYEGFTGLFCLTILWPGFLLLHFIKWELFEWPNMYQWSFLLVDGLLGTMLSQVLWLWYDIVSTNYFSIISFFLISLKIKQKLSSVDMLSPKPLHLNFWFKKCFLASQSRLIIFLKLFFLKFVPKFIIF